MAVQETNFERIFGSVSDIPVQETIDDLPIKIVEESKATTLKQAEHPIVVLCLDCSSSMSDTDSSEGVSRIELVKRYAKDFINTNAIKGLDKEKVELCIITFDSEITILKDFSPMTEISDDFSMIRANGLTSLYSALIVAVTSAKKRRDLLSAEGGSCYKPIIFVVTDGAPTDGNEMREPCHKLLAKYMDPGPDGKAKMNLVVCGMPGCDMQEMNALCQKTQLVGLTDTDGLEQAFRLLTASIAAVSNSEVTDTVIVNGINKANSKLVLPKSYNDSIIF